MNSHHSSGHRNGWRWRVIAALALASSTACAFSATHAASKATSIALQTSKETGQSIQAKLNGAAGTFLFDSGMGLSMITPATAAQMGCKPWGQTTGFRATGERVDMQKCNAAHLDIAGVALSMPTLAVFDLMKLMPAGMAPLSGAIGLDAFAGRQITIQSHAQRLVLETPDSLATRIRRAHAIPLRVVRDAQGAALTVDVGMPTHAGMVWMELDTGNRSGAHMIGKHVAALLGLKPDMPGPQTIDVDVAPGIRLKGDAVVSNLIMDGDIGSQFLDQWDLTLDLKAEKGWLAAAQ